MYADIYVYMFVLRSKKCDTTRLYIFHLGGVTNVSSDKYDGDHGDNKVLEDKNCC